MNTNPRKTMMTQRMTRREKRWKIGLLKSRVSNHSSVFSGTLPNCPVDSVVLTDQRADTNLISKECFESIMATGGNFNVINLLPRQRYDEIDSKSSITCWKKIEAAINLRIRHGSSLVLRHVVWRVCDQENSTTAIIGRTLLDSIGRSN